MINAAVGAVSVGDRKIVIMGNFILFDRCTVSDKKSISAAKRGEFQM